MLREIFNVKKIKLCFNKVVKYSTNNQLCYLKELFAYAQNADRISFNLFAASRGNIPAGAVETGYKVDGTVLYAAIANYKDEIYLGKVSAATKGLSIGWGGKELIIRDYFVLAAKGEWEEAYGGNVPVGALKVTEQSNGSIIYLARAHYKGGLYPANIIRGSSGATISYLGKEVCLYAYEVFINIDSFLIKRCSNKSIKNEIYGVVSPTMQL